VNSNILIIVLVVVAALYFMGSESNASTGAPQASGCSVAAIRAEHSAEWASMSQAERGFRGLQAAWCATEGGR